VTLQVRIRLEKRGWLDRTTRCGDWELTGKGWAKARREGARTIPGEAPAAQDDQRAALAA
jgi:hypothetical protein